jgi:NADPH:quinone reductase and related Zn-dependent oxidoreductases
LPSTSGTCSTYRRHALGAGGRLHGAFCTAHDALFTQAGLRAGERLLVHGAAGGVGIAAVQLGVAATRG